MKTTMKLTALLALGTLAVALPWSGRVTKSATGSTSATAHFPGGTRDAVVNITDVTSDKAGSVLKFAWGTTSDTLAAAVTAAGTNFTVFGPSALASNDVILAQSAAGRPAQFILDGTSACSLNQITVDYGP